MVTYRENTKLFPVTKTKHWSIGSCLALVHVLSHKWSICHKKIIYFKGESEGCDVQCLQCVDN